MESGIIGYKRKITRQNGVRHRKCTDTRNEGLKRKLTGKTSWFKARKDKDKKGGTDTRLRKRKDKRNESEKNDRQGWKDKMTDKRTPSAVIFIPRTQGR